jgi:general secretion pathway protein I
MDQLLTSFRADTRSAGDVSLKNGFTLIEVLVAISILVIAMTSVYRLQGDTFRMSASARFYSLAPMLAKSKLSEMEIQGFKNAAAGTGDFGQAYPGYTWNVNMEEMQSELLKDRKYHLTRIDLTISQDEDLSYALRTYRFYVD